MPALLCAEDAADVLAALEDIGGASDRDDLMERILRCTTELIPNDMCSFNWMAPGRVDAVLRPELEPGVFEHLNAVFQQHWEENPIAQHFGRTGDTRALTWDDVDDDGWRSGPLYCDFYAALGVTDQLVVRLPSPPGVVAGLACNRRSVPFDDRDRALLTTFGRHVVLQLASTTERSGLRAAFDVRGWRSIPVDDDGALVASRDEFSVDDRRELAARVAQLVRDARVAEGEGPLVPGDPEELVLPSGPFAAFLVPSSIPPHLLFLRPLDSGVQNPADVTPLLALGLTTREAQVAARLATGATNRQIGDALGITVGTVKKHLQRVFAVLHVETRAAAATRMVRLLE